MLLRCGDAARTSRQSRRQMTAGASLGEPLRWTGFPADAQVAICSQDRTASSTWGATPTGRVSRLEGSGVKPQDRTASTDTLLKSGNPPTQVSSPTHWLPMSDWLTRSPWSHREG
ncbi:MAG: hypothetical protein KME31_06910 [Tolypothrix carrinoi HA7290-LM1]|nr:hypothetical protein [Tolypothrix carrinoi HA7290-LM1]